MDYAGRIRVFVAAGLFIAAFVGTLLLSIRDLERSSDGSAASASASGAAAPASTEGRIADAGADEQHGGGPADVLLPDDELEDRFWAINELAASPSSTSVEALDHMIAASGDYRERLQAVSALKRILSSGEAGAEAREALRKAASDRNVDVAARASAALGDD